MTQFASRKTVRLRQMLLSPPLEFLCEAHNGVSARIVEEAGFKGIWASGLSISASAGLRDSNEMSWTQNLEILETMVDATSIPILVDGDTGYGNFNNVRRLVRKLESRGLAGVCIEDKVFPKTNSFIESGVQTLASIEEFTGKIRAAKDSQMDDAFVLIARTEAMIAGRGVHEALVRAEAYRKAGADAVFIHSKRADVKEIDAFMKEWAGRLPVVIAPTTYYATPTAQFREMRISVVIWANHIMRSAVTAMQNTAREIFQSECLDVVEKNVAPIKELFRLQNTAELEQAEKKYLPSLENAEFSSGQSAMQATRSPDLSV